MSAAIEVVGECPGRFLGYRLRRSGDAAGSQFPDSKVYYYRDGWVGLFDWDVERGEVGVVIT